jgi:hypothetical protein
MTLLATILLVSFPFGCSGNPVEPPPDHPDIRIAVARMNTDQTAIDAVKITVTRTQDGSIALPGRKIAVTASSGDVSLATDRGDGTYEALWTGETGSEVTLIARDTESDPVVETGLTFLALEFLSTEWDVPVKLAYPMSTDGWDTAPCLYPDGSGLTFAYITIDMVSLAAGITRSIGEERPGQVIPQTLNIYLATPPSDSPSWWTGWTVEHAQCNLFQSLPMHISAPSISGDGLSAFCTVQEYQGDSYGPTTIYSVDPEFQQTPVPLGPPVDIEDLGEDNPYYDSTHGWLYFDTYRLDDPFSKQDIWVAQTSGGGQFDTPYELEGDLNTADIETQAFVHEPASTIYFATDREQEEYQLAIWKAPLYGDYAGTAEPVARGELAIGRPSLTLDGEWFCFAYARAESGGANADIAMAHRLE